MIARCLWLLEAPQNKAVGNKAIVALCARLRQTACENPDPHVVSRAQFVPVVGSALEGLAEREAHELFSSFDEQMRDRAPYGAVIAALLATRRPAASGFLGKVDPSSHGEFADVLPVLRSCLDAYDPEADGISREELLELVQTCACDEDDLSLAEGACDACFGRSALGGETFTVDAVFDACQHEDPPLLLAELKRQLGRFRAEVHRELAAIIDSEDRSRPSDEQRGGRAKRGAQPVWDGRLDVAIVR